MTLQPGKRILDDVLGGGHVVDQHDCQPYERPAVAREQQPNIDGGHSLARLSHQPPLPATASRPPTPLKMDDRTKGCTPTT
jgi:hypothetical protein